MQRREFVASSAALLGLPHPVTEFRADEKPATAGTRKILIAGGGYGTAFIRYMATLTGKKHPKLCYLPTASADSQSGKPSEIFWTMASTIDAARREL